MDTQRGYTSLTNKLLATRITHFLERNAAYGMEYSLIRRPGAHQPVVPGTPCTFSTRRGQPVSVRRVTPDDTERIANMLRHMSDRTREQRYLMLRSWTAEAVQQEAQRMAQGQTHDHTTVIVTAHDHSSDQVLAVAELVRDAHEPTVSEFALLVRDDHQGGGIGSMLLKCLAQSAPSLGIAMLRAYVLPNNHAMQVVIRNLGLPYTAMFQQGELEIVVELPATPTQGSHNGSPFNQANALC